MALYLTSVLDRETVAYLRALHEIRLGPIKMAKPPIDPLSSTHSGQSASENALTRVDGDLTNLSTNFMVCLRYCSIRLTAVLSALVGA